MNKITLTFQNDWLASRREAGQRVVRQLEKWVALQKNVKLLLSTSDSLTVEMKPSDRSSFLDALGAELVSTFGEKSPWEHVVFSGDLKGLDVPQAFSEKEASGTAAAAPETSADDSAVAARLQVEKKSKKEETDPEAQPPVDPAAVVEEICSSVPVKHSPELTAYVRETARVIPMLQKLGAIESLWRQHLLLSVDAGYGRSDFLRGLSRLYKAFGLIEGDLGEKTVREIIIADVGADHDSIYTVDWDKALEIVKDMKQANAKNGLRRAIIYIDISSCQNKLATNEMKRVLRRINLYAGSFLVVFRVPFLESHVLRDIADALNDILNVRTVMVPPAPIADMADYARQEFDKRGFKLAEDATEAFEQLILLEKVDNSFFGYKTMDKMVHKAIFEKALTNCRKGVEDRTILKEDLRAASSQMAGTEDPLADMNKLVGMQKVCARLQEVIAQITTQRELAQKGKRVERPAIHMLFTGNPGTGKTTVARLAAKLMKKAGILSKGHLVEVKGRDLCGQYVGETAPKTSAICRDAYGSVLFIDEAYSLFRDDFSSARDYGREALDTLVAEMENHRDDFCVIMAGYKDEMDGMLQGNAGLKSRIPYEIEFPNYTRDDLEKIFFAMMDGNFDYDEDLPKAVHDFFGKLPDEVLNAKTFSNARFVRNLYERTWGKAAYRRTFSGKGAELKVLTCDLAGASEDREFKQLLEKPEHRAMGFNV